MLTRAARRGQALRSIEHVAEQLQLPWLCPALESTHPVTTQRRPTSTRRSLSQPNRLSASRPQVRRLASAAPYIGELDSGDEYVPFAAERHSQPFFGQHESLGPVPPPRSASPEPRDFFHIDYTTTLQPPRLKPTNHLEVRGTALEVEQTLEACLQMHRWDRAFVILKQLDRVHAMSPASLQRVYNRFLEAMVHDLIWNGNMANKEKINGWIEVYMRNVGIDPDAHTFALKIKVALSTLQGSKRDRTVRRYWEMAKEYQFENQVASLRDILTDNDLGKLTEICPLEIDFDLRDDVMRDEEEFVFSEADVTATQETAIRETDQKGLGLVSLKRSLALFSNPEDGQVVPRREDETVQEALDRYRQTKLERDSMQSAVERWKLEHDKRSKMGVAANYSSGKIGALMWQWHGLLVQRLKDELALIDEAERASIKSPEHRARCEYGPFLRLLEPEHTAALTSLSLLQIMGKIGISGSVKLSRLVGDLGRTFQAEVEAQKAKDKHIREQKASKSKATPAMVATEGSERITQLHISGLQEDSLRWSVAIYAKVGAALCEMFFDIAKMAITKSDPESGKDINLVQPIFQTQTTYRLGRKVGTANLHESFQELMLKQPAADLIAKQLPMVCKPRPWTGFSTGGYLEARQTMLRIKHEDQAQRDYGKAASDRGDLDQVYQGLDILGQTGWNINRQIFNVMLEAWNSGEAVANIPPMEKVFPELPRPGAESSPVERWKYYSKMRQIDNERRGLHSNRCFQNFQMEIARAFLDQTFYLPHNVDFRGRAYPIPPYLNQMGADNARGLLLFANGKELGLDGLRWLKIHLANVFGYDKASLGDRAEFASDHMDEIRDSCDNPLTGQRWWLSAEDPWQCLAACYEIKAASECEDPTKYVSHLPIHQDGTCNGLQHYAALGGDISGARQVNLEPGDKPADVYTGVAELVRSEIKLDADNGVEIAKLLNGRVTRKIVKQTVMTNVYGVTFTGAIRQVRKQVDDILPDLASIGQAGPAAVYIARKIFKGLGTLFEGAHEIQYWLGDCANRITHSISPAQLERIAQREFGDSQGVDIESIDKTSKMTKDKSRQRRQIIDNDDFRSTVIWTTPLKLPVVQPYRDSTAQTVQTNVQGLKLVEPCAADSVNHRKQLQGFPPNFVHSLDATHMMLSAVKAHELGLTFSAVHDSFWAHAADVKTLNHLLREAFIRMHGEDIIGRLAAEFRARYRGHLYLAKIPKKSPVAQKIIEYRANMQSSKSRVKSPSGKRGDTSKAQQYDEIVREIRRNRLLASSDPAEVAAGRKMVTASSIFEENDGHQYLQSKVSLGQTAIGEVPEADPVAVEDALQADVSNPNVDIEHVLEPLMDIEDFEVSGSGSAAESGSSRGRRKSRSKDAKGRPTVWLWLPLTFRDVPKKGTWDLQNVRNSVYFFS